jgi:ABC-type Fe3+-hydroxamate transport system substrate-binding protein
VPLKTDLVNGGALAVALAAASAATLLVQPETQVRAERTALATVPEAGATELIDARGVTVPIRDYQRVASLNTVADHLLLELLEPHRLIAVSGTTLTDHPAGWRFGDRAALPSSKEIEPVLVAQPDLVIASFFADEAFMTRLREQDIQVFDLGSMRGVDTTVQNIRALGALLDVRDRAQALEDRYLRELEALEGRVPEQDRVQGLYLSVYGDNLFGGSAGTSYGDMLHYAGVDDVAAEHGYRDWPQFSPEELLTMDPPLIVTQHQMGAVVCEHPLLGSLTACGPTGRIVEMPETYSSDPGLGVVGAASALHDLVHGEAP